MASEPDTGDGTPDRPRRLQRSVTDRYLGGVAGGIGERYAIDPALIRLGLVAVTLYLAYSRDSGAYLLVIVPYAVLWAALPTNAQRPVVLRLRHRDAWRELALIAVAMAVAFTLGSLSSFVVLALGGLAVVLLRDRPDVEATAGGETGADADLSLRGLVPGGSDVHRRAPRREPALWPLTLGLLVVIAVVALSLDRAIGNGVDPRIAIDVALLAVGGVLVLSAWRGRARITMLALVVLAPLWVATSVPDIGRFSGEGDLHVRPISLPEPATAGAAPTLDYELGYGALDVDLTDLPLDDRAMVDVNVSLTVGRARVTVPADVRVEVEGTVGLGTVEVDAPRHWRSDGEPALNRSLDRSYPALGTECGEIVVSENELVDLAERSGVDVVGTGAPSEPTTPTTPEDVPPPSEVADAIADAGYPRPTFAYEEDVWAGGEVVYDEFENPIATTTVAGQAASTLSFWEVSTSFEEFELCRPIPAPENPATVVITPTIGLGTLEIHRV